MDSYNSKYPIEYYEIGTPYMFYVGKTPCDKQEDIGHKEFEIAALASRGEAATPEQIKEYGKVLKTTADQKAEGYCFAERHVGVVIGKEYLGEHKKPAIDVMFLTDVGGKPAYITEKYIVSHTGVFCDDKEQFAAGGTVKMPDHIAASVGGQGGVTGGFTPVIKGKGNATGGFTPINGNENKDGGFTTV